MRPARIEIRRDLAILGAATALLFFVSLGARDLWNPNEPIYGEAVVEMAAQGDWLVPLVNGRSFTEKPILYFWAALAASSVLGGVSEFTIRTPAALSGVAGAILLYLLVVPYAGRPRARLAVALYATTFMVFWSSRSAQMDIVILATTLGVILPIVRMADHGLAPRVAWGLAGLAAGLGVLAKGPVAVVCPGIPVLLYLVLGGRSRVLRGSAPLLGLAVFLAVAAPWFVLLAARGATDVLFDVLVRQNFTRFLDPWDHDRPWWYYLKYFWIDLAPWAWFVPLAVALPGRDRDERALDRLAWLWIAGLLVFFSLSQSKRSPYILPVAPAVAILVSGLAERLFEARLDRLRTRACVVLSGLLGALALATGIGIQVFAVPAYPDLRAAGRAFCALLVVGGACTLAGFALRGSARWAVPTAWYSLVLVAYLVAAVWVLPGIDAYKSARPFCDRVRAVAGAAEPVASFKFWRWRACYTFYLGRPIDNLASLDELRDFWRSEDRVFVVVEEPGLREARAVLGDSRPWVRARVGGRTAYLFSNRPSTAEAAL